MDAVDINLQEAWFAMLDRIERDPSGAELRRRLARAARVRQRPVRAWSLAIRAGDTRIDEWGLNWSVNDDAANGRPHEVRITQADLADLTAPVDFGRWPGVSVPEAAKMCGRTPTIIHQWIKRGALQVEHYDRRVFNHRVGGQMATVWSYAPIDPNATSGRPPHRVWGAHWQRLARDLPQDWECALQRVPAPGGRIGSRGGVPWRWICPGRSLPLPRPAGGGRGEGSCGRMGGTGVPPVFHTCGRTCLVLYLPLPCLTIADYLGHADKLGIPAPPWADLRGQLPACAACWGIRATRLTGPHAWNEFVSHITGGLLSGSEVQRPEDDAPLQQKRPRPPRSSCQRVADRRRHVRAMMLEEVPQVEIARRLGVTRRLISSDVAHILRDAGIEPSRANRRGALIRKLQWGGAAEVDVAPALGLHGQEARVANLICRGWSCRAIAAELDVKPARANQLTARLFRKLDVHTRAELRRLATTANTRTTAATTNPPTAEQTRAAG